MGRQIKSIAICSQLGQKVNETPFQSTSSPITSSTLETIGKIAVAWGQPGQKLNTLPEK
jgi:hypothetical protein